MESDSEQTTKEDETEEENGESDHEERLGRKIRDKRQRRVSDVIDSLADHEGSISDGYVTPKHLYLNSPDQGYPMTPDLRTPDSVRAFQPSWYNRTPDVEDAMPNSDSAFSDQDVDSVLTTSIKIASMPVSMEDDRYNMNHQNRGKCIVFNHELFDMGFENREGSSIDAKKIKKTFQNLGFLVDIHDNFTHAEVIEKINKLSEEDHSDSDCICIFMLTHGISNEMICAKDVAYRAEKIWKPFTGDRCRSLAGKPKLFFFQACRGDELDDGVTLTRYFTQSASSETDSIETSYKIPTHADFLIAHSSVQGFFSWRNPTKGTWFIQCLCEVFDKYAETTDLLKMLTITARKISTERASYHDQDPTKNDKKQVPSVTSMLLRDIYFSPK